MSRAYYEVWNNEFLPEDREFYGRRMSERDAKEFALRKANEIGAHTQVVRVYGDGQREVQTVRPG